MRVNGEPGQLNTFVAVARRRRGRRAAGREAALAYVLLHKPAGRRDDRAATRRAGRRSSASSSTTSRVVPVGRLDVDTTGALLLTNDGPLAHRLAHPRYGVEKVYEVETWKEPNDEALRRLAEGVELEDGVTSPARVRRLGAARFELVLHEGRNRQVRRMCEAVGHRVRRLHRSVYAGLGVDGLGGRRVARAQSARGRAAPKKRPASLLTKPIRSNIASSVGSEAFRAFSAPRASSRCSSARVGAQLAVALLDRRQRLDDRLADVGLELPVARAVVARLDRIGRLAGERGEDVDQVRHARLVRRRAAPPSRSR